MLKVALRKADSVVILDVAGNIDINSSNFIEEIGWCLKNSHRDILCNFKDVNLIDYAGLSVLAIAYKNVLNHKGRMKFLNIPVHIKKIFCLVALDRVFEIYDDEKLAIKSFKAEEAISEIQKKQLRRRFRRLPLDIDIQFKAKSKKEEFYHGKMLNLSAVGLLLFADKIYPLGQILTIKLSLLPKYGLSELNTRVIWHVQKELQPQIYPGMGLEFYNIDNQTQKKIVKFVERNLPSSSVI